MSPFDVLIIILWGVISLFCDSLATKTRSSGLKVVYRLLMVVSFSILFSITFYVLLTVGAAS